MSSLLSSLWVGPAAVPEPIVAAVAAQRAVRPPPEDTFAWAWTPWWEQPERYAADLQRLRALVRGRPLVDLGSGRACLARPLARAVGASAYVGVDVHHPGEVDEATRDLHRSLGPLPGGTPPGLEVARVRCDAVTFAAGLRPGAACVLVGGLDHDVVASLAWHEALARAVARALGTDGVVFWTECSCVRHFSPLGLRELRGLALMDELAALDAQGGGWLGSGVHVASGG